MSDQYVFYPPNRAGVIFHLTVIAILTLAGAWGLWQAVHASIGPIFLLYLFPFFIALPLVPFLIYRLSSLENASYTLERDSLRLRWGLRVEVIPMVQIQGVQLFTDFGRGFPLPRVRWPGAVIGLRRMAQGRGTVEYMASQTRGLLVIATPEKLFAISPANLNNFLLAYQHFAEMGSLLPPPALSVQPTVFITRLWQARLARYLILAGALLSLALLVGVSLALPGLTQVSLGITPAGTPRTPIPSIRLMLLPVLNVSSYLVNLFLGGSYFRRPETQNLAYLLWSTSIFISILFLAAVYAILQIS